MITIELTNLKYRVSYPGPIETEYREFENLERALDFIKYQFGHDTAVAY